MDGGFQHIDVILMDSRRVLPEDWKQKKVITLCSTILMAHIIIQIIHVDRFDSILLEIFASGQPYFLHYAK